MTKYAIAYSDTTFSPETDFVYTRKADALEHLRENGFEPGRSLRTGALVKNPSSLYKTVDGTRIAAHIVSSKDYYSRLDACEYALHVAMCMQEIANQFGLEYIGWPDYLADNHYKNSTYVFDNVLAALFYTTTSGREYGCSLRLNCVSNNADALIGGPQDWVLNQKKAA